MLACGPHAAGGNWALLATVILQEEAVDEPLVLPYLLPILRAEPAYCWH
jgi:hypothetical protein